MAGPNSRLTEPYVILLLLSNGAHRNVDEVRAIDDPEQQNYQWTCFNRLKVRPLRQRIDAHHHLWKLGHFPYDWLSPDAPPRPFGDHTGIKHDYLASDYARDMAGTGVVASVFVESSANAPGAGEVEWVEGQADGGSMPAASVGYVDLRRPDAGEVLSGFQRSPRMRGIRMSLAWDATRPRWRFVETPDIMGTPEFRRGLAELDRRGLVFDTLVVPAQLAELAGVARAFPDLQIVVNHLGTPLHDTPQDVAEWSEGMRACAACPNMAVKLSGLWVIDRGWAPERIAGPVRMVVEAFGAGRCMWTSNYPVEKLMCRVDDQLRNLEAVLEDLPEEDKDMIFRGTAARVYRIPSAAEAAAVDGARQSVAR